MVAVVSSNPTGGNFFLLFFKTLNVNFVQNCQICVENEEPDSVNLQNMIIMSNFKTIFPYKCL